MARFSVLLSAALALACLCVISANASSTERSADQADSTAAGLSDSSSTLPTAVPRLNRRALLLKVEKAEINEWYGTKKVTKKIGGEEKKKQDEPEEETDEQQTAAEDAATEGVPTTPSTSGNLPVAPVIPNNSNNNNNNQNDPRPENTRTEDSARPTTNNSG